MRLSSQVNEGAHRFTFFAVRDSDGINAFALPGGFIGVNDGLVHGTRSEAQLAGVLAHEVAHVTQRHVARRSERRAASLASRRDARGDPDRRDHRPPSDAVLGGVSVAQGLAAQSRSTTPAPMNPKRTASASESWRPRDSIRTAMPEFFDTPEQRAGARDGTSRICCKPPRHLRAHRRDARARRAHGAAPDTGKHELPADAGATGARDDPKEVHYGTSTRTQGATSRGPSVSGTATRSPYSGPRPRRGVPRSMRCATGGRTFRSFSRPSDRLNWRRERPKRAKRFRTGWPFPRNVPVTMRYAETLMNAGTPSERTSYCSTSSTTWRQRPSRPGSRRLRPMPQGDVADSYYYMSEYHVISGDLALAINQLRLAQAVPGINSVQRERFDARIRELQEYLPKGKRAREVAEPQGPTPIPAVTARIAAGPEVAELPMPVLIRACAGALLVSLLAGCATTNVGTPGDPLERMNRATYSFNNAIDRAVLKPVATGYRDHVPQLVRNGIDNFLENLAFPTTIVNDLLQLKIKDTLIDLGRFAVEFDPRDRRPDGSGFALRHPAQRRGLRSDARPLGRALRPFPRAAVVRSLVGARRAVPTLTSRQICDLRSTWIGRWSGVSQEFHS